MGADGCKRQKEIFMKGCWKKMQKIPRAAPANILPQEL